MIAEALLLGTNIEKSFGATRALKGVTIALRPGEVHAIVGENGAGKSTLSKILSGVAEPDGGELSYRGERLRPWNPIVAKRLGVRCVHQELELAPTLTVAENIFLGDLPTRRGLVDHPEMERRAREVLKSLGADVDPRTVTGTLNVSNRQIVEIARALVRSATVLLLDEPTAALPPVEVRKLLDLMRRLREQGVAVVYISHRLDEVMEIADRISVLRDGRKVAELAAIETNRRELIAHILGEELAGSEFDKAEDVGSPLISVDCLRNGDDLHDVRFQVAKNQVVGFFGLLGAGQGSIAKSLFGLDKRAKAAECVIGGTRVLPADPKDAIRRNIGYVPADRRFEGLTLNLSILENLLLPSLERVSRWGFVQKRVARREGEAIASRFAVRMRDIDQPVRELSGGNQQKVVLAKWIMAGARILLLEEPTRGVDVGAKVEIYKNIRDVTRQGDRCCLLFSSDAEEIAIVCDSAYVLQRGRIVARLHGRNLTANRLVKEALG